MGSQFVFVRPISPWQGEAVIDNRNASKETLKEVIKHAEENLSNEQDGHKYLLLVVCDLKDQLEKLLIQDGYEKLSIDHSTLQFDVQQEINEIQLKEGLSIHPLSEVFDFDKLNDLIWKGFYGDDVPKIDADVQLSIKHAWLNFNREICSVILDKNGDYVSFCGFWYDEETQSAYLEPMITRKEYRHMGLGKAVVYHSLQLLKERGCKNAFVDPDDEPYDYYVKIGFKKFEYARFFQKTF